MTYSPEHIKAVNDRLEEYRKTIETGVNCFQNCNVCHTTPLKVVTFGYSYPDCLKCSLGGMGGGTNFQCNSDFRIEIAPLLGGLNSDIKLNPEELTAVKARYDELTKHLEGE